MIRRILPLMVALAAVSAIWSPAIAGHPYRKSTDRFYNYYVPPAGYGGVGAELYLSPRPTPPLVGHTYVTYQPLMPHEFLYPHSRTYTQRHCGGGRTTTCVTWTRDWNLLGWFKGTPKPVNAPRWCNQGTCTSCN